MFSLTGQPVEPTTVTVSAGENYTVTPATLDKNAEATTESTVVIKVADGKSASPDRQC